MAIFEREISAKVLLDDTEPISCRIENWQNVNGHTEFIIKVHRGPFSDQTWKIHKRYNDFLKLYQMLQVSGIPLEFPPKKLFGNLDPRFISERQQALQKFLDAVIMNPILVSSLPARSFVDPANYCQPFSEIALQHVSMVLRGEFGWEVAGPVAEIGWRLRKHYYMIRHKGRNKEELLGSWTDFGPDKYLSDKDMHAIFKSLHQIKHPYIADIKLCICSDTGGLVVREFNKDGSLRDLLCNAKPKMTFMKKYGNPEGHRILTLQEIALYGRQILEALKFLQEKGIPYGHLHSGNILIENGRIKLTDIENGVLGVPSYYRPYFVQHKKISNMEFLDVYCFGHVLYEMAIGAPLASSYLSEETSLADYPVQITKLLTSILSHDACKSSGLPTLSSLLSDPFFAQIHLSLTESDRPHFKLPTSVKDHLRTAFLKIEEHFRGDQKVVRSQKRLTKMQEMMSSEEEKRKQHKNRMHSERRLREQRSKDGSSRRNGNHLERCDSVTSSAATSVGTVTPPSGKGSGGPTPPPPPPPPPLQSESSADADVEDNDVIKDRSALLTAINSFNKSALKKVESKVKNMKV